MWRASADTDILQKHAAFERGRVVTGRGEFAESHRYGGYVDIHQNEWKTKRHEEMANLARARPRQGLLMRRHRARRRRRRESSLSGERRCRVSLWRVMRWRKVRIAPVSVGLFTVVTQKMRTDSRE